VLALVVSAVVAVQFDLQWAIVTPTALKKVRD